MLHRKTCGKSGRLVRQHSGHDQEGGGTALPLLALWPGEAKPSTALLRFFQSVSFGLKYSDGSELLRCLNKGHAQDAYSEGDQLTDLRNMAANMAQGRHLGSASELS